MAFSSGKNSVVLIKQYDMSTYFKQKSVSGQADEVDVTTFGESFRKYIAGLIEGRVSLQGFYDPAATSGSDALLHDVLDDTAAFPVSIFPVGMGTGGNMALLLKAIETSYQSQAAFQDAVLANAEFIGAGGARWGTVLHPGTSTGPYTTTDTFDTGRDNPSVGSTTKGAAFHLHVLTNTTGVQGTDIRIQDSADNSTFADVSGLAFTQVAAGALTSERIVLDSGSTLRRYVRVATKAPGSGQTGAITFVVAYSRNF